MPCASSAAPSTIDPTPQEVPWSVPLDEDAEHATYDPAQVATSFAMATRAALVLAAFRAPYRGRSTPVNAWWGSFDLAVSLFSGDPAAPPADDFICATRWTPRRSRSAGGPATGATGRPRSTPTRTRPVPGSPTRRCRRPPRAGTAALGEFLLDWDDVVAAPDPHAAALAFARSAFQHACAICDWDLELAASAEGTPPPLT